MCFNNKNIMNKIKSQRIESNNDMNEPYPTNLSVADEKNSNIKIYDHQPIIYKTSPFDGRKDNRKKITNEDGYLMHKNNQNENSEYSGHSEKLIKNEKMKEMINYISEPYNNKDYKKVKTTPITNINNNQIIIQNYPHSKTNFYTNNNILSENNNITHNKNNPNYNKYNNSNHIPQVNNFNERIQRQPYQQNINYNINNAITNPYPEFTDELNQKRFQHKVSKRQKNLGENYSKKIEEPPNSKRKHKSQKKKGVRSPQAKKIYLDEYENGLKYLNESYNLKNNNNNDTLNNVAFTNKNIDINNIKDHHIDKNILKQYRLIKEIEDNKKVKELKKQKEKLSRENKKLNRNFSNLEKEREKFENEKRLFLESNNRVINDTKKNEKRLLELENELQDKYLQKKNEIEEMRNKIKEEQNNLENERKTMHNTYQTKLDELENNFKMKEENQNYNNNLNIEKTKKEEENLRQKEKEINDLKNAFQERENNLNKKEAELKNKEIELQQKELELNNKYQDLLEKEKNMMNEREKFLNNKDENQKDFILKREQLRNKEEQLFNKENELKNEENMLKDKENEINNRQNIINDQNNELNNRQNELNNIQNELNDKQNEINEQQNKLFSQQNEINGKKKQLDMLNKEIQNKQNEIIKLNNDMMSDMNCPSKKNPNENLVIQNIKLDNIINIQNQNKQIGPKIVQNNINNNKNEDVIESFGPIKENNENNNYSKSHYSDAQNKDFNLQNQPNDINYDNNQENPQNDLQDNDDFPENHLHDIQDNDNHPENNGEDDFIVNDKNNNMNYNINNDMNNNLNENNNKNQSINHSTNSNKNIDNGLNDNSINNMNNNINNTNDNLQPQEQFMDNEEFYGEKQYEIEEQLNNFDNNLPDNEPNNNPDNNLENNNGEEEFNDIVDDFDNYINNQDNSQQLPENGQENEYENENMDINNMDLPFDESPEKNYQNEPFFEQEQEQGEEQEQELQENSEMYNFGEENINDNGMKLDNNNPENNYPNKNNGDLMGNNLPDNNLKNQAQHEDNLSLDFSNKDNKVVPDFFDNNNSKKQSQIINNNNDFNLDINSSNIPSSQNHLQNNNQNQIPPNERESNNLESGEIDLKDLHHDSFEENEMNNIDNENNDLSNGNNLNDENQKMDNEKEIDKITDEILIEEYNPSLGMKKIDVPNYMNSIVQCFSHIPEITNKIINLHIDPNFKDELPNLQLTKSYRNLLINAFCPEKVNNMNRQSYNPSKFKNTLFQLNPAFQNNENVEQKDFLNYLILKLHDELNTKKSNIINGQNENLTQNIISKSENDVLGDFLQNFTTKNNSVISKTLYGLKKQTFYCNQCQNSFYSFQCYSYLHFDINKVIDYKQNKYHRDDVEVTLNDCLDYFQKPETLRGDKGVFCPTCKQQTESTALMNIYSTKNILIFVLDRSTGNKFSTFPIQFKENINLRDYVQYKKQGEKTREKFFLGGVVNYFGDNYGNETYNSFIKMGKNNDWYCYDDENVYPVSFQDITNNGYPTILFYHKLTQK